MPFGGFAPLPIRLGGSSTEGWRPPDQARTAADLTAVKRTASLFKITFTTSHPSAPTIHAFHGAHGVGSAFFPDIAIVTAVGDVTLGWFARRWSDDYEISHPITMRHGRGGAHGATALFCTVDPQVFRFRVRIFNAAGTLTDGKVSVWMY